MRRSPWQTIQRGFSGSRLDSLLFDRGGSGRLAHHPTRSSFRGRRGLERGGRLFVRRRGPIFRFRVLLGDLPAEEPPQFDGDIFVDRAGVRLLLGYAQLRELVEDLVRLDLQLPSQLINTNLVHRYKTIVRRRTSLVWRTAVFRIVVRNAPRFYYGIRVASHLRSGFWVLGAGCWGRVQVRCVRLRGGGDFLCSD